MSATSAAPSEQAVLRAMVELADVSARVHGERELAQAFLHVLGPVFPGRTLVLTVVDPRTPNGAPATFELGSPASSERSPGFDFVLTTGEEPLGSLAVHYALDTPVPESDRARFESFATLLASSLRHIAARRETKNLRRYVGSFVDRATVPIALLGAPSRIRLVSRALLDLLGTSREEALGRDLLTYVVEDDRPSLARALGAAFDHGELGGPLELRLREPRGTAGRLGVDLEVMPSANGGIEAVIVLGRDLTEARQLEAQVSHADRLATVGQLAAGVAHELNNPLTSISAYAEHLLRKLERNDGDPGDREKLARIVASADRIQRFTRDLTTYARPGVGPRESLALDVVVEQALVFCEHVIDGAGVTVERDYEPDLPRIDGVRGQLHQVFINLLTNACHAMTHCEGGLHVSVMRAGPGLLEVRIADDGPGIDPSLRETIFQPFFTTKNEGKGTGLGLSIVRNIVTQHGGRVWVEGHASGAIFVVSLPVSRYVESNAGPTGS